MKQVVGWEQFRIGAQSSASQLAQVKVVVLKPLSILPPETLAFGIAEKDGERLKEVHLFKRYYFKVALC